MKFGEIGALQNTGNLLKIRRDWSLPFGGFEVPHIFTVTSIQDRFTLFSIKRFSTPKEGARTYNFLCRMKVLNTGYPLTIYSRDRLHQGRSSEHRGILASCICTYSIYTCINILYDIAYQLNVVCMHDINYATNVAICAISSYFTLALVACIHTYILAYAAMSMISTYISI